MVVIFVIVTGIGTCGSSAVAGILSYLGINMGIRVKPASVVNPKGYFEDIDYFEALHHHALVGMTRREAIKCWFLKRVNNDKVLPLIIGLKAPHFADNCEVTSAVATEIVPQIDVRYILVERSLEEIAQSKMVKYPRPKLTIDDYRKKVTSLQKKLDKFLSWNEQVHQRPLLTVSYVNLLTNTREEVNRIAEFCLDGLPEVVVYRMAHKNRIDNAVAFVDPELKRF